jgi:hypothetical protein
MRRHLPRGLLVLVTLIVSALAGPGMHASGTLTEVGPLELGEAATPATAVKRGSVSENVDGFRVAAGGEGVVSIPLTLPRPYEGRTLLRIWAYGPPGVRTTAVLRAADGSERTLGRASSWVGERFDVTEQARLGAVRLRVRGENATSQPVLFFDRIAPVAAPGSLKPRAPAWAVGLLVLLVTATLLELAGRLRRHWVLAPLLGLTAAALWNDVVSRAFEPLGAEASATWSAATEASWFGFHDGLLWGSWTSLSSLAVQVFHAFTPIVGTAPVSARAAALLTALLALAALYAFGHRAAGRLGGVLAILLAVVAVGFRDAVVAGTPLPALVLAAALFGYALHACLVNASPVALVMLGLCGALLALAEPTWLPGTLLVVVAVALACAERPLRWRAAVAGVLAVLVCVVPHLASTASQNDGRMLANIQARAVAARNAEFLGRGHGAAAPQQLARDPLAGRPVGLTSYLLSDHSASQLVGGVLSGGQRSITAFNKTDRGGVIGTLAVLVTLAATIFVLLLTRLRWLVLPMPLIVAPTLFITARAPFDPAAAGAALWPAMLVSTGILAFAVARLASPRLAPYLARLDALRASVRLPPLLGGPPAASDRNRS